MEEAPGPRPPADPKLASPSQVPASAVTLPQVAVPTKSRTGLAIALISLIAAGAAIAIVLATRKGHHPREAPTPPPLANTPIAIPLPPEDKPAATARVTLRFEPDPATAVIAIDGAPLAGHELVVDRSDAPHELTISAPGFVTRTETIRYGESQRIPIALEPVVKPGR